MARPLHPHRALGRSVTTFAVTDDAVTSGACRTAPTDVAAKYR